MTWICDDLDLNLGIVKRLGKDEPIIMTCEQAVALKVHLYFGDTHYQIMRNATTP